MNAAAIQRLRRTLAGDQAAYGLWVTLESASITEMAVALGLDWVVIDAEHGHLDWRDIVAHVRAAVRSETVTLVRIAELNPALIKRALDIGADGVVVPWVETADQLRQAVQFAHYPPAGTRGIGAERATAWGQAIAEHIAEAGENVLVVPIIETVHAGRNIKQMLCVDGVEIFFFGPADYSSTAGFAGQWEGPGVAEQINQIKDTIRAAGKHCAVVAARDEDLDNRHRQGFRLLGLGMDSGLLISGLRAKLSRLNRDRGLSSSLRAGIAQQPKPQSNVSPLRRPPERMRPDRPEKMNEPGSGPRSVLSPGVMFECLVGSHNAARNLTTGIVTFQPGAKLPYHVHEEFSESITVLSGTAEIEVEGRVYCLGAFDNVTIPRGLAHAAANASADRPCILHVAMPTDDPGRQLVTRHYPRLVMDQDSSGPTGAERVTRLASAAQYEAGPGTSFIDYFNSDLMPGIEMSGGYARFSEGGRLPAHFHDFDESITIVEGTAVCMVEGRRYLQSGYSTALQPRGRVHYFVNEQPEPMGMVWVYGGPKPERIVVDECCATAAGNPWKAQEVLSS